MPSFSPFSSNDKDRPFGKATRESDDKASSIGAPADYQVKISGTVYSKEVHSITLSQAIDDHHVLEVVVQAAAQPGGMEQEGLSATDAKKFIGSPITLSLATGEMGSVRGSDEWQLEFVGIVTRIRFDHEVGGFATASIIAHSPTIKMDGAKRSEVMMNMKPSDAIDKVVSKHGLTKGSIEAISPQYEYLLQHNETDYAFMMRMANSAGLFAYYDGKKLQVQKSPKTSEVSLQWGADLGSFTVGFGAESNSVIVRGWDYQAKQVVVGESSFDKLPKKSAGLGNDAGKKSGDVFTKDATWIDDAISSQKSAVDAQAAAEAGERVSHVATGSGVSLVPMVAPGVVLKISGTGQSSEGDYLVTRVVHRLDGDGYFNEFKCVMSANAYPSQPHRRQRVPQVFTAIVTDNADPDELGRVKVKALWSDEQESFWARLITPGAGPERGTMFVPEVNDEVAVIFDRGNPEAPLVIGGLWNGKDKPPLQSSQAVSGGKVEQRIIKTRAGLILLMDDTDKADTIQMILVDGKTMLEMKGGNQPTITVSSEKNIVVKAKAAVEVDAGGTLTLKSGGDLKIDAGGNLDISSKGNTTISTNANIEVSATQLKLAGKAKTEVTGAMLDVKGSAVTTIQGSIVKIN